MKPKHLLLISTLLLFSLFISACSSAAYASTGFYGLTTSTDTAFLAAGSQVHAIDLNTHTEKWLYPANKNNKGFYANPVLTSDGQLLVAGYDGNLNGVDPASGSLKHNFSGSANRLVASPLVIGNTIYQPSTDGNIYAIDLSSFSGHKFASTGGPIWASPVTDSNCGCIYIASMDHRVYKFDAIKGTELSKSIDLGGSVVGTPAVGLDGTLYVGTFGKQMIALNTSDLSVKWTFDTKDWVWSGPALANNVLYFGDLSGNFYALNINDRSAYFPQLQVGKPVVDTPLVSGDKIYFTAESDSLYIADTTGNISSKVIGGTIYSAPALAGDTILVTPSGFSSQLVALSLDGTQKWAFPPPK